MVLSSAVSPVWSVTASIATSQGVGSKLRQKGHSFFFPFLCFTRKAYPHYLSALINTISFENKAYFMFRNGETGFDKWLQCEAVIQICSYKKMCDETPMYIYALMLKSTRKRHPTSPCVQNSRHLSLHLLNRATTWSVPITTAPKYLPR